MGIDIHKYDKKLERVLKSIAEHPKISEKNKEHLLSFKDFKLAEGSAGLGRIEKYMFHLRRIAVWAGRKNLKKLKKKDIQAIVGKVQATKWSDWTKHDYKVAIKTFYKHLLGDDELYPDNVRWINTSMKSKNIKLPEEMLTEDDIKAMVQVADNPRDKALIATIGESGVRSGELLTLQVKHLTFDDLGAQVTVNGKTGMRKIRIVAAVPFLREWLKYHPKAEKMSAPLWVATGKGRLNTDGVRPLHPHSFGDSLKKWAKLAGIKKNVHAHLFRHSRATFLAKHLTEAQLCEYMGWTQGSRMAATYVHLSGRDMDDALLALYGIKDTNKQKGSKLRTRLCVICGEENPYTEELCQKCSKPLTPQAAVTFAEEHETLKNEVERLKLILDASKVENLGSENNREFTKRLIKSKQFQDLLSDALREFTE